MRDNFRPVETVAFDGAATFEAMTKAEAWCEAQGISVGRVQAGAPRGLLVGDFDIQKWRNLRRTDLASLHGEMAGDMRHGPVTVTLNASGVAALAALAAVHAAAEQTQ